MSGPVDLEMSPVVVGDEKDATRQTEAELSDDANTRPACFSNTAQELGFVFTATMAMAMGPFLTGAITVISSFVGRDLGMTTAQVTWLVAASSYVYTPPTSFIC